MKIIMVIMLNLILSSTLLAAEAPKKWNEPDVSQLVAENILYLPIADDRVKSVTIKPINEEIVDLSKINNPRIRAFSAIDKNHEDAYKEFSQIRLGVYKKLLLMLDYLPSNVGIAYSEGFRPLWKQKEYFDKKFREILAEVKDKNLAYEETTKHVSPFINNIPTHGTGAAIDMTLFEVKDEKASLMDMGMFDTTYGYNSQQETFSENTTEQQRKNRLMLLEAAAKAGLVNYGFEWWHYSYGDRAWGYVKKQNAIYELADDKNNPILLINKESYLKDFK